MAWHLVQPAKPIQLVPRDNQDQVLDVLAIAWDDQHHPNDNDLREFRYLVLQDGAKQPSWVLRTEVAELRHA